MTYVTWIEFIDEIVRHLENKCDGINGARAEARMKAW